MMEASEIVALLRENQSNYAAQDNTHAAFTAKVLTRIIAEVEGSAEDASSSDEADFVSPSIDELKDKYFGRQSVEHDSSCAQELLVIVFAIPRVPSSSERNEVIVLMPTAREVYPGLFTVAADLQTTSDLLADLPWNVALNGSVEAIRAS